jgi:predicted TPR repeat methyltransferase
LDRVLTLRPHDSTARDLLNALNQFPVQSAPAGCVERLFNRFADTFDHRMRGIDSQEEAFSGVFH